MSGDDGNRRLVAVVCLGCLCVASGGTIGCGESKRTAPTLTVERPLHLEEHLDIATIEGSEVPADVLSPLEWRFDEAQPDWQPANPAAPGRRAVQPERLDDALRLALDAVTGRLGAIFVELPAMQLADWGHVEIRARSPGGMRNVGLSFNYVADAPKPLPFQSNGDRAPLVSDGSEQTYRLSLESPYMTRWDGPWRHLAIWFNASPDEDEAVLDVLSIGMVPREMEFSSTGYGVRLEGRRSIEVSGRTAPGRRSLYMHAPGQVTFRLRVPPEGRLDFGVGVLRPDPPVTFAVTAQSDPGAPVTLWRETYADHEHWEHCFVDLSQLAEQTVSLSLEAESAREGAVALWAAPTVSGRSSHEKPNVIFYVIDGAGADYMSVYGYNRRTTPNLERIAAEGAVFQHAYSNSSFTPASTPSFLTSLHTSVMGGMRNRRYRAPDEALTMAEHLHRAGFQTAQFTSNPWAGRVGNLDRGLDVFRDFDVRSPAAGGGPNNSVSSVSLHEDFWRWRSQYPAEPFWVHFQTTDVHGPHAPPAPFAGLFISPERSRMRAQWKRELDEASGEGEGIWGGVFEESGVDRVAFMSASRDLYDETMAHQDYQLGRLVERLKAKGEWERTLLIVAADHGAAAGSADWNVLMREAVPAASDFSLRGTPMLRSGVSRIPLIVVWPGRIAPGQRFEDPVSMIDVLPTVLDLLDLPMPEVMQGQSLAPLLLGESGWEPRPVILDEFETDPATGELTGRIEVIDGRWGASLEINPDPTDSYWGKNAHEHGRPTPLLLYDLWADPMALTPLNSERPDLVEKYTRFLEQQFRAHQDLAQMFSRAEDSPLTPEQLETLRSLGYIQ